ncbi:unnamed protein product [Cylindrotheca closterium]|uniref:DUF4203 domain-containing protein n=1 Tax=Cylindrotheca closterium TaxID=2856 RepID=A0AAD2G747_9STRA|nr:unnamed protein product [Cylindrotheca closterium]
MMSQPRQPLQAAGNDSRTKHRRRTASSLMTMSKNSRSFSGLSFILLVTSLLLLQELVMVVNAQETAGVSSSSSSLSSSLQRTERQEFISSSTTSAFHNRRRNLSSSSQKSKQASSSSEDDKKDESKSTPSATVGSIETQKTDTVDVVSAINIDKNDDDNQTPVKSINVTAISMTTCVKIEYAVSYLTNLDWKDIDIRNENNGQGNNKNIWLDVYLFELVLLPASLAMVFFGSQLLLPVCTMTAAGLGIFCIFHFVNNYFKGGLDCPMKLALSGVSATLCAMGAAAFVRFGLFTLGTVSAGGMSYLFFDAFPDLDPGLNMTAAVAASGGETASKVTEAALASDISPHAWVITILLAMAGGLFLRLYEQASLEVLTAVLGGVGVSYSVHAFLLSQHVDLDRSVVFLIASIVTMIGSRFQRNRRLRIMELQANPYHDYKGQLPVHMPPQPPPPPVIQPAGPPVQANPNLSLNNWNQLQQSLSSTNHLLQQQRQNDNANEMEAMAEELTNLLTSFQERIQERDRSKKQ